MGGAMGGVMGGAMGGVMGENNLQLSHGNCIQCIYRESLL